MMYVNNKFERREPHVRTGVRAAPAKCQQSKEKGDAADTVLAILVIAVYFIFLLFTPRRHVDENSSEQKKRTRLGAQ